MSSSRTNRITPLGDRPSQVCESKSRLLITILLAALPWLVPLEAPAWGSGHDDIVREVIARLPADLRDTFSPETIDDAIRHHSHYPDSFDAFLPEDVGEPAVARLSASGVTKRYDLHSERGMAHAFLMLVDALGEGDPEPIALWIAAYSHVIADMAASNHDPLVHTATYGWADWKLKLPSGERDFSQLRSLLDLAGSAHDPEGGKAAFEAAIDRMRLEDSGQKPDELLAEIMLYGQAGADFCAPRGVRVLEGAVGWFDRQDPASREMLWKNIGELGAWAVVRTLRDVAIARRYAESDRELVLPPGVEKAHRENVARFLARRNLENDALFAPLIRKIDDATEPVTGIVFEPCWAMNGAMLGFASRVQSAAIARSWQEKGTPFASLDLRDTITEGFPSAKRMPRLVVVAGSFRSYQSLDADAFDRNLQAYLADGGRVLWITGTGQPPAGTFSALRNAMHRDDPASKLPVPEGDFLGARIRLSDDGSAPFVVEHSPATRAGWQQPFSPWIYDNEKNPKLRPIAILETDTLSFPVGVVDTDGRRAILPIYAVTPFLLGGEDRIEVPHEPTLDDASSTVLEKALDALRPKTP